MLQRFVFLVLVTAAAIGCYNPSFKEGIACGDGGACPPDLTCIDSICRRPGSIDAPGSPGGSISDAALSDGASPDTALPDAAPVGCQSNADCQTPPDACSESGTCNLVTHTCAFVARDCSSMGDDCNRGVCDPQTGCVKQAKADGIDCGTGTTCTQFGPCDYADDCDQVAMHTRSCTDHKCQAGTCMRSDRDDMQSCSRNTEDDPCGIVYRNCGICGGSSEEGCAPDGQQTCTCDNKTCRNGTCSITSTTSCMNSCTELGDGQICHRDQGDCAPGDRLTCCRAGFCTHPCGCSF